MHKNKKFSRHFTINKRDRLLLTLIYQITMPIQDKSGSIVFIIMVYDEIKLHVSTKKNKNKIRTRMPRRLDQSKCL
jgi:hypothetical protein